MNGALVVGASGGLGLALTRALLARSAHAVVFAACRAPHASAALTALAACHRERLVPLTLDVTAEDTLAAAATAVAARGARLDLLINAAGILHDATLVPERRLAEVTPAALQRAFAVNAVGPLLVARAFARLFDRDQRSVLANLSARVGSIGDNRLGGWYGYRASKAALNMFTRNLAVELGRRHRGLICVALHPGTVDTALSQPFQARVPPARLFTPERAATQLLAVMDALTVGDSGSFFAWDG
ncbi:MAG: SDR family oxidoreductase, partial [Gammaproteobacteria bacterium]